MTDAPTGEFRSALLAAIPRMRGYARALCRHQHLADDLVQETLLRAWESRAQLRDSAAIKPWLFTILRNVFYETRARLRHEVEDVNDAHALQLAAPANQTENIDVDGVLKCLDTLQAHLREVLLLVCVEGLSYEQASEICGCNVGTIKSRVNRGRAALLKAMGADASVSVHRLLQIAA